MDEQDEESPLGGRLAESRGQRLEDDDAVEPSPSSGLRMAEGSNSSGSDRAAARPTMTMSATVGGAEDDQEDEDVPDWLAFAAFARSLGAKGKGSSTTTHEPVIPRRGEKDFEPAATSTHKAYQESLLEASRNALFGAIHSSSKDGRSHNSRVHNRAIWDERHQRAYMVDANDPAMAPGVGRNAPPEEEDEDEGEGEDEDEQAGIGTAGKTTAGTKSTAGKRAVNDRQATVHGIHFQTMGKYSSERKRIELLPEEALYLLERGTIECWTEPLPHPPEFNEERVPMSIQHAWSMMINADQLTSERYQIYAYLKRLGYTVVRAAPVAPLTLPAPFDKSSRETQSMIAAIVRAVVSTVRLSIAPIYAVIEGFRKACIGPTLSALDRLDLLVRGHRRSMVGGQRWFTYDQLFTALQLTSRSTTTKSQLENVEARSKLSNKRLANPYSVFYNVYKPITKYKKSDPPEPDFRIAVISAQTTPVPDLYDFVNIFKSLPDVYQRSLLVPAASARDGRNTTNTQGLVYRIWKPFSQMIEKIMGTMAARREEDKGGKKANFKGAGRGGGGGGGGHAKAVKAPSLTRPAPYAKLKTGRKAAIIAVVDNGTVSWQKFGMTDFTEFPWVGDGGTDSWERDVGPSLV